jgi:hypothetical protein
LNRLGYRIKDPFGDEPPGALRREGTIFLNTVQ